MAHRKTHNSPLALTYAQSLLDLGWERNSAVDLGQELNEIAQLLQNEPIFRDYLADPGIGQAERAQAVETIFKGRVAELVYNFIEVLNSHGRLRLLEQIAAAYGDLLEAKLGNVEVGVTTAQQLGADELEQVRQRVGQTLGKNAIVHQYVDDSIIGGLVIRVGDQVIDASVKQQLASIRQQLLAGAP